MILNLNIILIKLKIKTWYIILKYDKLFKIFHKIARFLKKQNISIFLLI